MPPKTNSDGSVTTPGTIEVVKDELEKAVEHLMAMVQEGLPTSVMVQRLQDDHRLDYEVALKMTATVVARLKKYFKDRGCPIQAKSKAGIILPDGFER